MDINCDLGEGETSEVRRALFHAVNSVNLACGGHAGDRETLMEGLSLAKALGLRAGAHPGLPGAFGRGPVRMSPLGLRDLLDKQVGLWLTVADVVHLPLHHIKLHGSLYHAVNREQNLAEALVLWMSQNTPNARIYAPSQGALIHVAQHYQHELWPELFADRAYSVDGFLVERAEEGAVLSNPDQVLARLEHWRITGELKTNANTWIRVQAKTVCVHGDTPDAIVLAQRIRAWINQWSS